MDVAKKKSLYDPPVEHFKWINSNQVGFSDFIGQLSSKTGWNQLQIDELLYEQGIFINKKRLDTKNLPSFIPEEAQVEVFRFKTPPLSIPLNRAHILYEDDVCLAVNKPAWLPVQGTKVSKRFSLEEQLKKLTGNLNLMAVHRLDRQTSGIVLFGKDSNKTGKLMKLFSERHVEKIYLAVLKGELKHSEGEIKGYMFRDFSRLPQVYYRLDANEKKKSKFSQTQYKVLRVENAGTLVEAKPLTGRTHQLRVHFASLGFPILGDYLYAATRRSRDFNILSDDQKKEAPLVDDQRIQLHAKSLEFILKGKTIRIEAPMPDDFVIH